MYNPRNEFPHIVQVIPTTSIVDEIGGVVVVEGEPKSMRAFVDTPKSSEKFDYEKIGVTVSRAMFWPYNIAILPTDRIQFEGEKFELASEPMDQGGQHLVNRALLKKQRQ